jgi:hypothetical protein
MALEGGVRKHSSGILTEKKSIAFKSGNQGGQATCLSRPIHIPEK